ncbi:hypothetical protein OPIT5_22635 [Opitutaceae bacterium TAV5]|nr:hypothetical protein OPIT5_22635 [Opitutaceae bacterium TAV5]
MHSSPDDPAHPLPAGRPKPTAIVTGASAGYGAGIAEALCRAGFAVFVTARSAGKLGQVAARIGATAIVADVTRPEDRDRVVSTVLAAGGRIDVLVNNAGAAGRVACVDGQTDEEIVRTLTLNLTSVFFGCRRVGAVMRRQKSGVMLNISSVCARYSWPGWSVYSAAKAGVERLGKGLYAELREAGVRVTTLTPSWGATEFGNASAIAGHPSLAPEIRTRCTRPAELGKIVVDIVCAPSHLEILDLTVVPTVQEIIPL